MVVYTPLPLKSIHFTLDITLFLVTFLLYRDGNATLKGMCGSLRRQNNIAQYIILGTVQLLHNKGEF